jgi:ABC-type branched-chain amino acid transport systems, periplasmic component
MNTRSSRFLCRIFALCLVAAFASDSRAAEPIRIGEINSYSGLPAFTLPYRNGWKLALADINAKGGVLGRPLEVISRDDGGKPGDAVTAANELIAREGVVLLMGTFFSHVGLAVSDFAKQRQVLFLAAEPLSDALVWEKGNRYTFRLRPSVTMQAGMLAKPAAELAAQRWASVAPNYEYGKSAVAAFQRIMGEKRHDLQWVGEQWPPLNKIDAGPLVQALANDTPGAIFNVTFGADLAQFVREGDTRGLFRDRTVVSLLTGEPEYLDPLGKDAPVGWIVTGYPWYAIETPEHRAFLDAYQRAYNDYPRLGSVVGYIAMHTVATIIATAGSTETPRMIAAAEGIEVDTPFGPITFRAVDHQSTMGAFVGRIALKDNKGIMVDWYYANGADYLPPPDVAKSLRSAE